MKAMPRRILTALASLLLVLAGCTQVGITGREQLNFMPDSIMTSMSLQQYSQFISSSKPGGDTQQNAMVEQIGRAHV
jgi:hypothetical protein